LPATLAGEPFADLVPELLRVEDHTVEIEDDRVDHAGK
jgi:hypothetical protein